MTNAARFFALGAVIVLAFDTVGAASSRVIGFRYSILTIGTYLIYGSVCFVAGRRFGVLSAVLGGAALGFVDATLGWAISWAIGPGRLPGGTLSSAQLLSVIVFVVLLGAGLGLLGGIAGWTLRGRSADA